MEMLFDTYLIVDWSSNSSPKKGADSIWLGWTRRTDGSAETLNPSTRVEASRLVLDLLRRWSADGDRVFVGFDFPYGYPQGFANALGLTGAEPAWRRIWKALSAEVQDAKNNANNRFEVAANLNALLGNIAFWGCPEAKVCETLPTRSPYFPVETLRGSRLSRYRLTEIALRQRGKGVQEIWKVFYQGSVGGQVLTGIPILERVRFASDLDPFSRVWPLETGFTPEPVPSSGPFILHAEIWPGIIDQLDTVGTSFRDQAQVRELAGLLRQWDESSRLGELFDRPPGLTDEEVRACVEEEGWTLGSHSPADWKGSKPEGRQGGRLEGRVAIVTDAAPGIGAATARLLADHGAVEDRFVTGEELARRPDLNPCALVNGRVVPMAPAGRIHGEVESRLDVELALYARKTGSGRVMVGEVGIYTGRDPDTVRGADIVFMSHERHARCGPSAFLDVAPELVVEILSPEDRPGQVNEKIQEYLSAGVDRVWFVNPRRRSVLVYGPPGKAEGLEVGDILRDEEILPGFSLPLSELFPD